MSESRKQYTLGLDTSNYTSSVALIDNNFSIVADKRKPIKVEDGMKGIRQSEALFQHLDNIPELLEDVLCEYGQNIACVCASSKPRPVEGSYMPVFKAGLNYGKVVAKSLNVPFYETSHQEGHIEAGKYDVIHDYSQDLATFHLSGGTTEILLKNEIIGETKDISFGQLIDRLGVASGFPFPAGAKLDEIACGYKDIINKKSSNFDFKPISTDGIKVNLSGLDSQLKRIVENDIAREELNEIIVSVFNLITQCLITLTRRVKKQYNISCFLFVGGVSSSKFIRDVLTEEFKDSDIKVFFAKPELSSDNGIGTAIIGGKKLWR